MKFENFKNENYDVYKLKETVNNFIKMSNKDSGYIIGSRNFIRIVLYEVIGISEFKQLTVKEYKIWEGRIKNAIESVASDIERSKNNIIKDAEELQLSEERRTGINPEALNNL